MKRNIMSKALFYSVFVGAYVLSLTARGDGGGTLIIQCNSPGYPAGSVSYADAGGVNTVRGLLGYIPYGTTSISFSPVSGDPPDNPSWYETHPFTGDYITLHFPSPCDEDASFTLNGGTYIVVLDSSGCYDPAATTASNAPPPALPSPPPADDNQDNNNSDCGDSSDCGCGGMPVWRISEPYISLWLRDEPLGYQPAVGPRISFKLAFKQWETTNGLNPNIFSVGKKWNFSWLSYVAQDQHGSNVVHFPHGGDETFSGTTNYLTNTRLTGDTRAYLINASRG